MAGARNEKDQTMKIINATRHNPTPGQTDAGVVQPANATHEEMIELMTFDQPPTAEEIVQRAEALADLALSVAREENATRVMIGGAPFFMAAAAAALEKNGLHVVYAFTQREAIETVGDDGEVIKKTVFRHAGFVDHVGRQTKIVRKKHDTFAVIKVGEKPVVYSNPHG